MCSADIPCRPASYSLPPPPPPTCPADCKSEPQCAKYTYCAYPPNSLPPSLFATCTDPATGIEEAPSCLLWSGEPEWGGGGGGRVVMCVHVEGELIKSYGHELLVQLSDQQTFAC